MAYPIPILTAAARPVSIVDDTFAILQRGGPGPHVQLIKLSDLHPVYPPVSKVVELYDTHVGTLIRSKADTCERS